MIELMTDIADNVVAIKCIGKLTGDDYEQVIIPAIESKLKKYDKIRLLYQLTPDFSGYEVEAIWDDTKVSLKHFAQFEKIAMVTDTEWIARSVKMFGFIIPGEVKTFGNNQLDEAKAWIVTDRKTATRAQILQSALACFAQSGYHQTTMDDIVNRSGLSKGALYWHFKSKKELFVALIEWFVLQMGEEITHALTDDMSAADKIYSMTQLSLQGSAQLVPFIKVFLDFWAQTPDDEQLNQIFSSMLEGYQQRLGEIIEEGVASGEFHPVEEPQKLSLALFGMLDALFLYYTLLGDKVDMRGSAEAAINEVIAGLTRRD